MWRKIHSWIGLVAALLVMTLSLTGTVLATRPIYDAYQISSFAGNDTVADLIERIATEQPKVVPQRLKILPSGEAKLEYSKRGRNKETAIALDTGEFLRKQKEPKLYTFMRKLHRSFLLGENGRIITAIGGVAMTLLCISGLFLLLRRLGGWRQLFDSIALRGAGNLHSALGRWALLPLMITALTAIYLSAVTFDFISTGADTPPAFPESLEELEPVEPWTLRALQNIPASKVQEIIYPIPEDWFDVWTVKTDSEYIFVDQFTGEILSTESLPMLTRVMDWVVFLHTAEGSAFWGILLLMSSLSVPFFAITGTMVWWRSLKNGKGRIPQNASAGNATILITVGSEGGTTWGFAKALHKGLVDAGERVRTIEMNKLGTHYPKLEKLLVLTSTYGDGDAPKNATRFISLLQKSKLDSLDSLAYAVLAFGDKAFVQFCAFAHETEQALQQKVGNPLLPLAEIDKQSVQSFDVWCEQLAEKIGKPLAISYTPQKPKTRQLALIQQQRFGESLGALTTVLRFSADKLPKHQPGDLVAIYPPNTTTPRLYSLGSDASKDGFLEICVRLQEGGLCSTWLCNLQIGDTIDVAVEINERFRLPRKQSVVMIGAGTGIAPFTGMIRNNQKHRAFDLYWGGRHPEADAIYGREIQDWVSTNRLEHFHPAWSRTDKIYVQDNIRRDRAHLLERLRAGATIMVCGGRAMAEAVQSEINSIAEELGTTVTELKRRNRYREDVY